MTDVASAKFALLLAASPVGENTEIKLPEILLLKEAHFIITSPGFDHVCVRCCDHKLRE